MITPLMTREPCTYFDNSGVDNSRIRCDDAAAHSSLREHGNNATGICEDALSRVTRVV